MRVALWTSTLLGCLSWGLAQSTTASSSSSSSSSSSGDMEELQQAVELLVSHGVPIHNLCTTSDAAASDNTILPQCSYDTVNLADYDSSWDGLSFGWQRFLADDEHHTQMFYLTHGIGALVCVAMAALAAGLTSGMLSLDPLMLLIKMRAAPTPQEQAQAATLLPIIKQHHLLLVTLLLLNSLANEALPLFLSALVSPIVSVVLSVTLVLVFGEIIPSAVFTGPNKVRIAAQMVPIVRLCMLLLWPLAYPIARVLDVLLEDENDAGETSFDRGELSALVRIQYEERMAHKLRKKEEKVQEVQMVIPPEATPDVVDNSGSLDFASRHRLRASKRRLSRYDEELSASLWTARTASDNEDDLRNRKKPPMTFATEEEKKHHRRRTSIHMDEVNMVEGALNMKTRVALDVYTPLHGMFSISRDLVLNETNVFKIYTSGFSRVPVFMPDPEQPDSTTSVCGVLMTKQLMLVKTNEERALSTLPLVIPPCISPEMNLVDILNLFQTGRVGHLALVCARPNIGQDLLLEGKPLTDETGLMGIITMEDVLEALLQEEIYDETDNEYHPID
eukprot:Nitzschia sp. Nitz4//scaffold47_size129522//11522//13207//NITZ4_003534-RA/size129522-processed-gene-0.153-mRNA-1//-1//CDS//3329552749//7672//frame0